MITEIFYAFGLVLSGIAIFLMALCIWMGDLR